MKEQYRRLDKVYLFPNDMVMAFDQHGRQWPEYQGHKDEAVPKIKRDYPDIEIVPMEPK